MTAVLHGPGANERPMDERDAVQGVVELVSLAEQAVEVEEIAGFEQRPLTNQSAEPGQVPSAARPSHCGAPMSLSVSPAPANGSHSDGGVWPAWACDCGFRVDAEASDFVGSVWTAAALVESLQWEMDSAKEALGQAVRQAKLAGVQGRDLQLAAGLTEPDLKELLG